MNMDLDLKIADSADIYTGLFNLHRKEIFASSPDYINNIRLEAMESFKKIKFPRKKDENYKYTFIEERFRNELSHAFHPKMIEFEIKDIFQCDIPELETEVILVLNGFYFSPYNSLTKLTNGVVYGSMSAASREYPELFKKHYSRYAKFENDSFTALNTAFAQDGIFLFVPDNVIFDKPLQIINLLLSNESLMVQHRNLFIIGENAQANVLICDHTLSINHFLTNSVTEIHAARNATFDITRLQNEHNDSVQITNTHILQKDSSRVTANYITLHGGLVRNNIKVDLDGEYCENHSMGLFLIDKTQHVDNFITINHLKPNCTSNQLFKGILDDQSTGAFTGRINVFRDAQKTLAYQRNNNLILTNTAKMNAKPQLEIYADDVKCSHGATVGQLDTDALFYLRSRGISKKESRHLLMYAFAYEVLSQIKIPTLKERVIELVEKRIRGELSRCNNCKMKCR
jgi:Fe-S cluster assembly protein SufD